jgi:hypothetical protein
MITVLGNRLALDELRHIPVVRPEKAGARWQGVQHHVLATTILQTLSKRGIEVSQQTWAVDKTGSALVGGLQVQFPSYMGVPDIEGMRYSLGLRHDNAMQRALTFSVGTQVLVCLNGVITGEHVLCRRHTTGIDLAGEVGSGVDRFIEEAAKVKGVISALQNRYLTKTLVDHLLMEAGRQKLVPWSHVGQVHDEYHHPSHVEFAQPTGWGLYNAFNHVIKKSNPVRQLQSLERFRTIVLN